MRSLKCIFILILPMNLFAAEFEVFTLSNRIVDESTATVYYVDQGDRVLRAINEKMLLAGVANEDQGKPYVTSELSNALSNQIKGLLKAGKYQLKYFPAIVIDGQYVIYGTTDIRVYGEMKP